MPQTAKTKVFESGDVFIRDDLSREYSSISAGVTGVAGGQLYLAGTPMVVTNPTLNTATAIGATEVQNLANAAINGYLIDEIFVPASGTTKVAIYTKFVGLVVNRDALPLVPPVVAGPVYLLSSHVLNLDRLLIAHRSEPTRKMEQLK